MRRAGDMHFRGYRGKIFCSAEGYRAPLIDRCRRGFSGALLPDTAIPSCSHRTLPDMRRFVSWRPAGRRPRSSDIGSRSSNQPSGLSCNSANAGAVTPTALGSDTWQGILLAGPSRSTLTPMLGSVLACTTCTTDPDTQVHACEGSTHKRNCTFESAGLMYSGS